MADSSMRIVQRFGSALNLNVHFHALVLDGVYTAASPFARPVFHPAAELEDEDVKRTRPVSPWSEPLEPRAPSSMMA